MLKTIVGNAICFLCVCSMIFLPGLGATQARSERIKTYVGSDACKECHEEEYRNYKAYAKKAQSYDSIKKMKKGLTEFEFQGCFECHTTGHGKPGGFVSEKETPFLKNAGCEVCHGPGSLHCDTETAADIKGQLTIKDCEGCHNDERVAEFNYKPLIYGGAH